MLLLLSFVLFIFSNVICIEILFNEFIIQNILNFLIHFLILLILLNQNFIDIFHYYKCIFIAKIESLRRLSHDSLIKVMNYATSLLLQNNFFFHQIRIQISFVVYQKINPNKKKNALNDCRCIIRIIQFEIC